MMVPVLLIITWGASVLTVGRMKGSDLFKHTLVTALANTSRCEPMSPAERLKALSLRDIGGYSHR